MGTHSAHVPNTVTLPTGDDDDNSVLGSGSFSNVTRVTIRRYNSNSNNENEYYALKSLKRDMLPEVLRHCYKILLRWTYHNSHTIVMNSF